MNTHSKKETQQTSAFTFCSVLPMIMRLLMPTAKGVNVSTNGYEGIRTGADHIGVSTVLGVGLSTNGRARGGQPLAHVFFSSSSCLHKMPRHEGRLRLVQALRGYARLCNVAQCTDSSGRKLVTEMMDHIPPPTHAQPRPMGKHTHLPEAP